MKRSAHFSPPAVGGSSLLVIFALLAMCVFAILSLTAAQADGRLSKASAEKVSAYYAADLQGQKQFAKLRQTQTEPGDYAFTCPVSENSRLQVKLRFDGAQWQVLQWQTVVGETTGIQETLTLWDGT